MKTTMEQMIEGLEYVRANLMGEGFAGSVDIVDSVLAHLRASPAPAAGGMTVPDGWKWELVPDYKVGMLVYFGGTQYKIYALGDRPGTFDLCHPTEKQQDRYINVPPHRLTPLAAAPSAGNALPADRTMIPAAPEALAEVVIGLSEWAERKDHVDPWYAEGVQLMWGELKRLQTLCAAQPADSAAAPAAMTDLRQELHALLADDDLTDEKLREAAANLLPRIHDAMLTAQADHSAQAQAGEVALPEPHGWLYDWTHSSATGRPDEQYTTFVQEEQSARAREPNENVRAVFTADQLRAYGNARALAAGAGMQERDAKDAARYRWLREGKPGAWSQIMIYAGDGLDKAVDAAIATKEAKGGEA